MAPLPAETQSQDNLQLARSTDIRIVSAAGDRKQWTVSLSSDMTNVLHIKQRISELEDNHPEPGAQKLIHMGKILQDEDELEEIFNRRHTTTRNPTFFLIIRPIAHTENIGFASKSSELSQESNQTIAHSTSAETSTANHSEAFSSSTLSHIETAGALRSRIVPAGPVVVTRSSTGGLLSPVIPPGSMDTVTPTPTSSDVPLGSTVDIPQIVHLPVYYQVVLINNEPHLIHIPANPTNTLETRTTNTITQSFVIQGNIVQPLPAQPIIALPPLAQQNIHAHAQAPPVQDPLQAQARVYRLRIRMREVWLFVRLAFMVGLFSSGNFSWPRFLMLNFIATMIFVYQTGRANGARNVFNLQQGRAQNRDVVNNQDPGAGRGVNLLHTVQEALVMFLTSLVPSEADHRNRRENNNNQQPMDAGILPVV
ncbi:hypothetical protein NEOLI_005306 [Neolecta irregularis DAH-3]|uniref:Ubiquitin-like domain-containing protein n=1 Tax=Neolecta irregularis (strain DAH-3) TaxID=1198029 RepID=A0A1U7LMB2_NEOID|nr:hypothetical protein NEOLI_005306 [Neolecta irregularis DAH-3]|eukprot:OLL23768.1 hypothetical protein NEOLI_005306 [Neolecta irregularis DAH-3]